MSRLPVPVFKDERTPETVTGAVTKLIEETKEAIDRQIALAKASAMSKPHLFETAYAAADIFQMHLARARAVAEPPDILIQPDMRDAMPTAFDRADEFVEEGYHSLMSQRAEIERLLSG